jgi:molybdopterin converting factor small subunit
MSIQATLHPFLNDGTEVRISVNGNTVGECIGSILQQYPDMGKKLFDKKGKLKGYVEVLVNDHSIDTNDELGCAVRDGDSMTIIVYLSGG